MHRYSLWMALAAQTLERLGPDAARVQGLLVTVDPERDTQPMLAKYVPAFHPSFLGLRGTPAETAKTAKEFKAYYSANRKPGDAGIYSVDHTSAIFMFDPEGRLRLFASANGRTPETMAQDIRKLLDS